jgi:glycine/D-amino acid oxidase-like deaminating enzyme
LAGFVTPDLVVQGCARRAARLGARVEQSCAVERIVVDGGRVTGVETGRGRIETDCVVLTAGVWSRELAVTAGLDLPVEPERRFMYVTERAPQFPARLPLTIFSTSFSSIANASRSSSEARAVAGRPRTARGEAAAGARRTRGCATRSRASTR